MSIRRSLGERLTAVTALVAVGVGGTALVACGDSRKCEQTVVIGSLHEGQSLGFDDRATEEFPDLSLTNVVGQVIARVRTHGKDSGNISVPNQPNAVVGANNPSTHIDTFGASIPSQIIVSPSGVVGDDLTRLVHAVSRQC